MHVHLWFARNCAATSLALVLVRRVQALLEGADGLHHARHLLRRRQDRRAEVQRARLLAEAAAGHHHDALRLQQLQRPARVQRQLAALLRVQLVVVPRVRRRQRQAREGVHRTLHRLAREAHHRVQLRRQHRRARLHAVEDVRELLREGRVALAARRRRAAHQRRHHLAVHVAAQVDGAHLDEFRVQISGEVHLFEVPTAAPALTDHALRRRVQRHQHRLVVRLRHPQHHLAEARELLASRVDVHLVHLVRQQHHVVVVAEAHDVLHDSPLQHVAGGVAGVDRHEQPRRRLGLVHALVVRRLEVCRVHAPALRLLQVVRRLHAAQQRNLRRVCWVLRDGDHHTIRRSADQRLHQQPHTGARTVRQRDAICRRQRRRLAVALVDVGRHRLPRKVVPQRARVRARRRRPDALQVLARALHHILREARHHHLVLQQEGRVHQRHDLPVEGERRLLQRLRVADVAVHEALEGVAALARRDLLVDLVGAGGDESAHSVLRGDDTGVERQLRRRLGQRGVEHILLVAFFGF
ncbi:alanine transaminase [Strigomonas culicis]|uniref:Alanine transaminase n=1 Tax=Strigomonas culicis TaxID=28005 RepID=S9UEC3_9TRYP|nr:alanine transaminase [Strigomonas culicis]|eukprot:EPY27288.1 alanine transaminase [Strigomonas culicis]